MSIVDIFSKEDRVGIKISSLYEILKGCTQRDMLMRAVKCRVPHKYIEMIMKSDEQEENKL